MSFTRFFCFRLWTVASIRGWQYWQWLLSPCVCYKINESIRLQTLEKSSRWWCKRFYKTMYHNTHLLLLDTSWFYNKIKLRINNCGIRFNIVLVARSVMINTSDYSLLTKNNNLQFIILNELGSWSSYLGRLVSILISVSTRQTRHSRWNKHCYQFFIYWAWECTHYLRHV